MGEKAYAFAHIEEGNPISRHSNQCDSNVSQSVALKFFMDDEFKATFMLCTLPKSWDVFVVAMSNSNVYDFVS